MTTDPAANAAKQIASRANADGYLRADDIVDIIRAAYAERDQAVDELAQAAAGALALLDEESTLVNSETAENLRAALARWHKLTK